jgi:hypothetical protein
MLFAGFVFLHFAGTIRSVLGTAETTVPGTAQLARVAFAGALIGIAGMTTAIVMIAAASSEGADANPVVSRAVTTASAGPFLVAAMGFAALLMAAGLLTLRSGVFARWVGIVALLGAVSFVITFLTLIAGTGEDSVFGFGFFPGVLALVIWSVATSIASGPKSGNRACRELDHILCRGGVCQPPIARCPFSAAAAAMRGGESRALRTSLQVASTRRSR